jgi:hypothetical protein
VPGGLRAGQRARVSRDQDPAGGALTAEASGARASQSSVERPAAQRRGAWRDETQRRYRAGHCGLRSRRPTSAFASDGRGRAMVPSRRVMRLPNTQLVSLLGRNWPRSTAVRPPLAERWRCGGHLTPWRRPQVATCGSGRSLCQLRMPEQRLSPGDSRARQMRIGWLIWGGIGHHRRPLSAGGVPVALWCPFDDTSPAAVPRAASPGSRASCGDLTSSPGQGQGRTRRATLRPTG